MLTVMQLLPALNVGGVERGTVEIAGALVEAGHRSIVVSAGGQLVEELGHLGARHIEIPIGRKRLSTLRYVSRLREICRSEKVDIVHARSRLPAWIGYRAINAMAPAERPHWVTTVHGPYTVNFYSRIMTSGERVIAISKFIRDYITKNYPSVPPENIHVIARGVDRAEYAHDFTPAPGWLAQWHTQNPQFAHRKLLVLPGRMTRWKGQTEFIEMIAALVQQGVNMHGVVAGGATPRRKSFDIELRQLVSNLGIGEHVSFVGKRDDLREILASADIAYSMTIEPEAFGRTTLEALSVGTPVIGYDHGGTGEILREVLPSGLITPRSVTEAVDATIQFLGKPVSVPKVHRFTLSKMRQGTIEVYESLGPKPG